MNNLISGLPAVGKGKWRWHLVAVFTAAVWSTTFVSTKILLNHGLSPENIFIYRFVIAYLGIVLFAGKRLFADNVKDELLFLLAGVTGGSLYFVTENTALRFTYASNVSILISATPLFTMAISAIVFRHRIRGQMLVGALIALVGVSMVVFNGDPRFRMSPKGDFLTLTAAFCWAAYSVILKYLGQKDYPILFTTRKVFFYGLASMLLFMPFSPVSFYFGLLTEPVVYWNILFLGVMASLVCFALFNRVVDEIGPDKASNYIYLNPIGTIITAVIFLHEPLSWMAVTGAIVTITGVVIVEKCHPAKPGDIAA